MATDALKDQVVLLTGASSGIGWAAALEFARHGARLALAARREEKLRKLAALLGSLKAESLVLPCDVSEPRQSQAALEAVLKRWGRLDILVNNAGINSNRRFHEQPWEEAEGILRTNYLGAAFLIHAALPVLLRQKKGHVVNISSIAGLLGLPYMASYCASKFALTGLTEALRREYYESGVTFTLLCPGTVDTPMASESLKDERLASLARPKTAEQVARKIISCCLRRSPELIYGDAPGFLLRLSKFIPGLVDWVIHQGAKRVHPLGRSVRPR